MDNYLLLVIKDYYFADCFLYAEIVATEY